MNIGPEFGLEEFIISVGSRVNTYSIETYVILIEILYFIITCHAIVRTLIDYLRMLVPCSVTL